MRATAIPVIAIVLVVSGCYLSSTEYGDAGAIDTAQDPVADDILGDTIPDDPTEHVDSAYDPVDAGPDTLPDLVPDVPPDLPPSCGNGIVEAGEECDDGNLSNDDACLEGCVSAACGDGFLWIGVEECDDGNLVDGDACSSSCMSDRCGDALEWGGHSYWICRPVGDWYHAEQHCALVFGGHLVMIDDAEEHAFVYASTEPYGSFEFWIGITDVATEGTWLTVAGDPIAFEAWQPGEPNNSHGGECGTGPEEDCALMYSSYWDGNWNDYPCNCAGDNRWFVCEDVP